MLLCSQPVRECTIPPNIMKIKWGRLLVLNILNCISMIVSEQSLHYFDEIHKTCHCFRFLQTQTDVYSGVSN